MGNSQGRPSKNFGGNNKHHGAPISQSGTRLPFTPKPPKGNKPMFGGKPPIPGKKKF